MLFSGIIPMWRFLLPKIIILALWNFEIGMVHLLLLIYKWFLTEKILFLGILLPQKSKTSNLKWKKSDLHTCEASPPPSQGKEARNRDLFFINLSENQATKFQTRYIIFFLRILAFMEFAKIAEIGVPNFKVIPKIITKLESEGNCNKTYKSL